MSDGTRTHTLLLLAPGDNVAVATCDLQPGVAPHFGRRPGRCHPCGVGLGHKVAVRAIAPAERVVRCGMPIGSATATTCT